MNEGWIHHLLVNAVTQMNHAAEKATRKLVGAARATGVKAAGTVHPLLVLQEAGSSEHSSNSATH